jgi:ribosomal protein S18 acetylase RimI-like enzyme
MHEPIIINRATKEDAELIADLSRTTFYDTYSGQNTKEDMDKFMNEQFTKKNLMAEVVSDENIFLLAYKESKPVGYVRMRENKTPAELKDVPAIEIARIYSVQQEVGKGVGSALMQRCIDIARERKKQVIWLNVWKKNQPAINFYVKWGFEICGITHFTLGNDPQQDWMMKKDLS